MAKNNNLKDFLTDLADGIRAKKGTTDKINPQDIRSEYESLLEVGGATVTTKEGWQGTAVPNTGYVEKIYFNTNLSIDEVVGIIESADLNYDEQNIYVLFSNADGSANICVIYVSSDEVYIYNGNTALFGTSKMSDVDWLGWNPDLINNSNCYYLNTENVIGDYGMGTQNDKLSSLFSITPLVETSSESISLSGEYDGTPIIIDDLNSKWQGTPVPNTGYIEKVYFNTNLSVDETVSYLSNLTFDENGQYILFEGEQNPGSDFKPNLVVCRMPKESFEVEGIELDDDIYLILASPSLDNNDNIVFLNIDPSLVGDEGKIGWNLESLEFNVDALNDSVGLENAQLSSLFSITPFTQTKANTIDIKALIDKKKIPLEITVNVAGSGGGSGEEYPNETIKYYKENRNKNYPYFPLPSEMEETQDTIYMLYGASGYMCCPVFNITFTECVCTIQKYMNTTLVSEYVESVTSGTTKYLQFSEEDSDYNTYNYIVIKMQGSITKHYLNYNPKFNGVEYNSNSSSELLEVSGKCVSCDIKVVNNNSNKNHQTLEYYSFLGVTTTDMSYTFNNCYSLQTIPQLDTHLVTNMSYTFNNCYSLQTIPLLDTHLVTNMNKMFGYCYSLQTIPQLDTHLVTNMSYMFNYCPSLQTISLLDTHSVTDMSYMFNYCPSLQTIPLLDTHSVTDMSYMFNKCYLLYKLDITNVKKSFSLSDSTMLTQSELVKILNNLATVEKTQTLTLGSTLLAKLTEEEKAIATAKGWTLA